jgi:hypothetical protein
MQEQVKGALRRGAWLAAPAAMLLLGSQAATAAQPATCYQDNSGRILERRTPGAREVPCPAAGTPRRTEPTPAPPTATLGAPSTPASAGTNAPAPTANNVTPVTVSPIPRPVIEDYVASVPVPDRWRIVDTLGYKDRWYDPYNRNILKGDKPITEGGDWFFSLGVISDSVVESRQVATPSAGVTTEDPGTNGFFSDADQLAFSETIATEFVLYQGDTVFKPPVWEFRLIPAVNINYVKLGEVGNVNIDPRDGTTRTDSFVGLQGAFIDKHLYDVSDNYDFDSIRIGIQPFSSDFRGFLFQDNQLGLRWFGSRANNRYQYNVAYFRRIEKDTNSGLNDIGAPLRKDDIVTANIYRQDTFVPGFTFEASLLYNRNTEDGENYYDKNGLIQRPASIGREAPRSYDVLYAGLGGDGHFGRLNVTTVLYGVGGKEKQGVFVDAPVDVRAGFAAAELSVDFDWLRPRLSLLYATGDKDPFDDVSTGFDAVLENPQFAGADTSYWIRQAIPLVGGGKVALSGRNGVLNSLRPSKDEGQSNFMNPGTMLAGLGLDADLLPTLRTSLNLNSVWFATTEPIEVVRQQANVGKHIGYDLSASLTWRPLMSQNIVIRASYAQLFQGKGLDGLYPQKNPRYILLNALLAY